LFTDYNKTIDYLFKLERRGIKYNLNNIKKLLSFLNNPEKKFKSIHIAGTNGKGSVSSILNSILIEKGFRCGLYTSPHITDFRERILVNGEWASKKFIIDFTNKINSLIKKIEPSFFEVATAMAFEYFSKRKVDYAVIETGLGGRLDSTNVLMPELSLITTIAIDHVDFLGDTIEKIAYEKAGIIKKNIPVVTGNLKPAALTEIKKKTEKTKSILINSSLKKIKITKRSEKGLDFNFEDQKFNFPVIGDYQLNNLRAALTAIQALSEKNDLPFSKAVIQRGLSNIKNNSNFYGRFDILQQSPKIVTDVSHNEQAFENISANLKYLKYKKLVIIFGMMKDKNYQKCLNILSKLNAKIILTRPLYPRAEEPQKLYEAVKNKSKFIPVHNLNDAFSQALNLSDKNDMILVTGSFFLVSEFLETYKKFYK
jgi:dihydrofolate synthase/folylpolyglutamate synthase